MAALQGYRERAKAAGRSVERVVAAYEAGWSGFWLARLLGHAASKTHVIQPSSVLLIAGLGGPNPMGSTQSCCCARC